MKLFSINLSLDY